jgi:hypothetical protein
MRVHIRSVSTLATTVLCSCLLSGVAFAKAKPPKPTAPTESAAARAARLAMAEDVGERKDSALRAPVLTSTAVNTGEAASAGPSDAPTAQPARPTGPLSGALEELVSRQIERNAAASAQIEKCLAGATETTVEVTIHVADKIATIFPVGENPVGACLAGVHGLRLSLPDQAFSWHFSRGSADHREMATR